MDKQKNELEYCRAGSYVILITFWFNYQCPQWNVFQTVFWVELPTLRQCWSLLENMSSGATENIQTQTNILMSIYKSIWVFNPYIGLTRGLLQPPKIFFYTFKHSTFSWNDRGWDIVFQPIPLIITKNK